MERYDRPMANRSLFEKFEVRSYLRSDAIVITTDRWMDGEADIAQMSKNFAFY